MKVIALISGGKDSCFNMMQCVAEGHSIVALANLKPHTGKDELDSYMYQTVGHHAITLYGEAMELPLFRRTISGSSSETGKNYLPNSADEVEDLFELLKTIKDRMPDADAVSCGAILSDYQRVRVENVCSRLNLVVLSYLWRREQSQLLEEMIECGVEAIVIKVAALGLKPNEDLGKSIKEIFPHMIAMKEQWGLNVCGEGGEYETFVTDCPLFVRRIVVDNSDIVIHSDDAFAPVGYINLLSAHLVDKPDLAGLSQSERVRSVPITRSTDTVDEMLENYSTDTVLPSDDAAVIYTCENGSSQVLGDAALEVALDSLENFCISGLVAQQQSTSLQDSITKCMETLKECVEMKLIAQMEDISFVHLFLSSMADFSMVNSIYKSYFSTNPPARVCVEAVLPVGVILQLDCIGCKNHSERQAMHVQGISHWAPANIGPYSQAVRDGHWVKISGQIGLVPGSMQLVEGGIGCESALALRHVQRILTALHSGVNMYNVVFCVSYVTDENYIPIAKHQYRLAVPEKEIPFGECPSSLHSLIHYVIVPALPRGALVEWEVTAFTDSSHFNYTETFEDFSECRIRSEMLASDDFNDYVAKISIDTKCRPADIQLDLDLSSLASHIGSHLFGKQLKDLKDYSTVGNMTVFYPGKTFSYQNVVQGLHASLKSSLKGKKLTINAVPVLKLEFSSRTFSIFLYRMCSTMPVT